MKRDDPIEAAVAATPSREQRVQAVRTRLDFPVVIVGAGINGLGTFRDLSLQGIACLLIDKGDFCSGTSSAPSRMIHGGLKYLETGEFRLVEESVVERNRLLRNAAHLVKPLEMVVPIRRWTGGELPSVLRFFGANGKLKQRGWLIVKAGLAVYDHFSRHNRIAPTHSMISGQQLHALMPDIDPGVKSAATYYDARVLMPERLGLELALDAMAAEPRSVALNHVALESMQGGRLRLRDTLSGEALDVGAQVVINAAGPWIDRANQSLGTRQPLIGGTKGSHLMLDLPALHDQLDGRMVYFDPGDGRICLVAPLAGKVLLGSTDIPAEDADRVVCEDAEVDYMLGALEAMFPGLGASRAQIVFSYCGVRPLPRSDAASPGEISRDHSIHVAEPDGTRPFPVLSLVGGKWTTFRAFSEQATDQVLRRLGATRRCDTRELPIGGGRGLDRHAPTWQALTARVAALLHGDRIVAWRLVGRYGTRALELAQRFDVANDQPVRGLPGYSEEEVRACVAIEMVEHLDDFVLRRTPLALGGQVTLQNAVALAELIGTLKQWDGERQRWEVEALVTVLRDRHRIDLSTGRFI